MTIGFIGTRTYQEFLDFSGNDPRDGQAEMCRLLEELIEKPESEVAQYAIQAPTGTGKSFSALLTGVYGSVRGWRTVIGTSTLKLLSQYEGDIRDVQHVFPNVKFSLLRGAENYLCKNRAFKRLEQVKADQRKDLINQLALFEKGFTAVVPTFARADTEFCADCAKAYKESEYSSTKCEYARARYEAVLSDVVVTTHAMIAVDLKLDGKILGETRLTVFDEAHDAHKYLTYTRDFGQYSFNQLLRKGVASSLGFEKVRALTEHFQYLDDLEPYSSVETQWYSPGPDLAENLLKIWPTFAEVSNMRKASEGFTGKDANDIERLVNFMETGLIVLQDIQRGKTDGGMAFWMSGRRYRLARMEIDGILTAKLAERRVAWISATLGTASQPTYVLDKAGLGRLGVEFFDLESPFNYAKQLSYSIYTDEHAVSALVDLVNRQGGEGGCLVLTTSHGKKNKIAEQLASRHGYSWGVNLRMQENSDSESRVTGNDALVLDHMRACEEPPIPDPAPVLIGTDAFSAGLNLPGLCLTKLVIDGLRPIREDGAYIQWRSRWLEANGKSGFTDFRLPEQAISLEQQIGRVIRSVYCRGTVLIYVPARDWNKGTNGESWQIVEEAFQRFAGMSQWTGEKIA